MNNAGTKSENELEIMTVALTGNPNSGKTTVFNAFTKLRQKVGNYPGVTVEKKTGRLVLAKDKIINVIDLPGTYSLAVRSPDEEVARNVLLGKIADCPKPDLAVCVVDAGNLERNLYLVSQIQDLGLPVIVALNMMDEVEDQGIEIDCHKLSAHLTAPVIPMTANKNKGIEELKRVIAEGVKWGYRRRWKMPELMEQEVARFAAMLEKETGLGRRSSFSEAVDRISIRVIEQKEEKSNSSPETKQDSVVEEVERIRQKLSASGIRWRSAAIEARYDWIKSILQDVIRKNKNAKVNMTNRIDSFLTHPFWGWVIFVGIMGFMFFLIFSIAAYPMDWIDSGFGALSDWVETVMPAGDLRDLVTQGIIAGVGGVVIFLPQILILFFFIGILQDTGYMARAAFIMDSVMRRIGLHGKSFIPLLSSYACAIPGIMAARTIESPKDRLVTILVAPFMSCSARLPVYTIMIAVLMPGATAWQKAGILLAMYFLGSVTAGLFAWIFKRTLLKSERPVFVMEMPPYRMPSFQTILLHMWERSRMFLKRAGTVILALSIVLWFLMSYPKHKNEGEADVLKNSYAGRFGQMIEPAIRPLGYDWRIGIGLIGSFAAREVFVSTMSIVFNLNEDEEFESLRESFSGATWPDGRPLFTPLVCLSLMVFFVFALQCISTIAVVYRETNGWKWPLFQVVYMTLFAYMVAFLVYQGGRLLGLA